MTSGDSKHGARALVPPVAPAAGSGHDRLATALFCAALALGLLRFWRLGEWSVWEDEVFTLADTLQLDDVLPRNPLFYWLMSLVLEVRDGWPDEWTLRILPAVFGWLGIAIVHWAFAPVLGRRRAAAAALLVAASSWHLYWSQNARFYTLAQDLGLLGGGLVLRSLFLPRAGSYWRSVIGMFAVVAGALVHATAGLLLPGMLFATAVMPWLGGEPTPEFRRQRRLFAWIAGFGLLAISPWVREVWLDFHAAKRASSTAHFALSSGFYFTPLLLVAALIGGLRALRQRSGEGMWIALVCVGAVGIVVAASFFVQASAQYVFVLLPWVAALATLAPGVRPEDGSAPRFAVALLLIAAPLAVDSLLYFGLRHGDRPRWREALQYVWSERRSEDLVLTNCSPAAEYYYRPGSVNLRRPVMAPRVNRYDPTIEAHWARQDRRTWFVLNRERLADWTGANRSRFLRMLTEDCRLRQIYEVPSQSRDLDVLVYLREP